MYTRGVVVCVCMREGLLFKCVREGLLFGYVQELGVYERWVCTRAGGWYLGVYERGCLSVYERGCLSV